MHIFLLSPEVTPWSKSGGLGDVAGALPRALSRLPETRVTVITAAHRSSTVRLRRNRDLQERRTITTPRGLHSYISMRATPHLRLIFHDEPALWNRDGLYGDRDGDYSDNFERFSQLAALTVALARAEQPDVVHLNDWQSTLFFLHAAPDEFPTLFSIHNIAFQGCALAAHLRPLASRDVVLPLASDGTTNLMELALRSASSVSTVSPTYAREVLTPEYGFGLDGVLRSAPRRVTGILNGTDSSWDPAQSHAIEAQYASPGEEGHEACRRALLRQCGWPDDGTPVAAVISRLTWQKGIDIILEAVPDLLADGRLRICVLGTGDRELADGLRHLAERFPSAADVRIAYDERWARQLLAGSDFFLMPSRFEPCGLTQMYAMRFGCIPVVRATGGLLDTVPDVEQQHDRGTGFSFQNASANALRRTLLRAIDYRSSEDQWNTLRRRAMKRNFGWDVAARAYRDLYGDLWSRHRTNWEEPA